MREIVFRGKHKATGKWCEGNLHVDKQGVAIITPDDTPLGSYGQVDPDTVGQFTGLTDKNGVRIFEGDIIDPKGYSWSRGNKCIVRMDTDRAGWYPFARGDGCGCCEEETYSNGYCVVIGNVHDNPELMGK